MGLLESLRAGLGKLLTLPLHFMAIDPLCIHVPAVAHQELQLAVVHSSGIDAHKSVTELVQTNGRINPVGFLVALPAAV